MKCVVVQKKGGNVKTIPPYKPLPHDSHSSDSSGEKEAEAEAGAAPGETTPTHAKSKGVRHRSTASIIQTIGYQNKDNIDRPITAIKCSVYIGRNAL